MGARLAEVAAVGQTRSRHEDSPEGGEFRACWGARARATMGMKIGEVFEGGTPGGMRMVGGTRRDFAKGQIRARHEDSPKGGEFRAWHGFAGVTRLDIFEGGTGLRRTSGSGFSRGVPLCGGCYERREKSCGAIISSLLLNKWHDTATLVNSS